MFMFFPLFFPQDSDSGGWSGVRDNSKSIPFSKFTMKLYKTIKRHPNITFTKLAKKMKKDVNDPELNACIRVLENSKIIKHNNENGFL